MSQTNDLMVLIGGKSASGKSASLRKIKNPEGVIYANCEAGKKLPFKSKFIEKTLTDPLQVFEVFEYAETRKDIHTIVIDSLTFLLDMYESIYVLNSSNTQKAWGEFAQFYKTLMQRYVAASTKKVIFLAHIMDELNKAEMEMETKVPVKGSLKNNGVEAYFSIVIHATKMPIKALEPYKGPMLNITPQEEALGFKHVFQTQVTKDTVGARIRGPMGLFETNQTYIDNDVQVLMDHMIQYYS